MKGTNNPILRAKLEYGKQKHAELQGSYSCDEREVTLSSGRPDCILFRDNNCQVIEFKPDSWDESKAADQARAYLDDVRERFKDDDRAKRCKQTDGGAEYTAVGITYPHCGP